MPPGSNCEANDLCVLIGRRDIEMRQLPGLVYGHIARMKSGEEILPELIIGPLSGRNKVLRKETISGGTNCIAKIDVGETRRMYIRLCIV